MRPDGHFDLCGFARRYRRPAVVGCDSAAVHAVKGGEMSVSKQFANAYELFGRVPTISQLVPGLIVAWLLVKPFKALEPWLSTFVEIPQADTPRWIALIIASYAIGSILKVLGSHLDGPVYDYFFKRVVKRGVNPRLHDAREQARVDLGRELPENFDYFNHAVSAVKASGLKNAADEIDSYLASSKFWRSVAVTLLAASIALVWSDAGMFAVAGIALAVIALWSYCTERWHGTQRAYEYYINVRQHRATVR
jgi:hypothetical protein